jgi:D-sedoheptulose 7-phosphate isomerase
MTFSQQFLAEAKQVIDALDVDAIERVAAILADTRSSGGRLFILGVGGSAANASHAVNDFRKIAGIEAYAPTDNVSELTARTNDEGWATVFESWLRVSRLTARDTLLVFSVGGGNAEKNVSPNLVSALQFAATVGARITGIVGRDGGYTARSADACVIVPTVNLKHVTPHAEAFQAVIWHLIVSHPLLKQSETKWESVKEVTAQRRRAVFLDRDGVLNQAVLRDGKPYPPASLAELRIVEGAAEGLARLKQLGFLLLVVTNQPDVARGTQARETVESLHNALRDALPVDEFLVCFHDDADGCQCRKPAPGLLLQAQDRMGVDLQRSFLIGDRWRDIDAARAAGCRGVWIDFGYRERGPSLPPDARAASLTEAIDWIVWQVKLEEDGNNDSRR